MTRQEYNHRRGRNELQTTHVEWRKGHSGQKLEDRPKPKADKYKMKQRSGGGSSQSSHPNSLHNLPPVSTPAAFYCSVVVCSANLCVSPVPLPLQGPLTRDASCW